MQMIDTFSTPKPAALRIGDGVIDSEKPEHAQGFCKVFDDHVDPKGKSDEGKELSPEATIEVDKIASDDSDETMSEDGELAIDRDIEEPEILTESELEKVSNSNGESIGSQWRTADAEGGFLTQNDLLETNLGVVPAVTATQDGRAFRSTNSEPNPVFTPVATNHTQPRMRQNPSPIEAVMIREMGSNGRSLGIVGGAIVEPQPTVPIKVGGANVPVTASDGLAYHPEVKSDAVKLAADAVRASPVQSVSMEEGRRFAPHSLLLESDPVIKAFDPKTTVKADVQMGDVRLLATSTAMPNNTQFQPAVPFNPVVLGHGVLGEDSSNSSFEFTMEARQEGRLQQVSSTAPAPTRMEMNQSVIRQMADAVRAQMVTEKTIEISLRPAELGRVRIAMSPADTGMVVTIQAERAETLELMRRNIDDLARSLADMGHENPTFNFEQGGAFADKDDRPLGSQHTHDDSPMEQNPRNESPTHTQTLRTQTTGVDILL